MEEIRKLCPAESELCYQESGTNVPCPVTGCGKIMPQRSNLRLHMIKVHKIDMPTGNTAQSHCLHAKTKGKTAKVQYHCPQDGCVYNSLSSRHFTSLKNLKQHYMHVHAEKKFKCSLCGQGFGLEHGLRRHLQSCGKIFTCDVCGCPYGIREALLTHCARNLHPVPERYRQPASSTRQLPLPLPQITCIQAPTTAVPMATAAICADKPSSITHSGTSMAETVTTEQQNTNTDIVNANVNSSVVLKECTPKTSEPGTRTTDMALSVASSVSVRESGPKMLAPKPNVILINILPMPAATAPQILYISDACSVPPAPKRPCTIAPKPKTKTAISVVTSGESLQSSPLDLSPGKKKTIEIQTDLLSPSKTRHRNRRSACKMTNSTQTLSDVLLKRKNVAQTQTTGDYILKQAMQSASILTRKESKGSQVSPRAKLKRAYGNVQSSQTQTVCSPKPTRKRRRRKSNYGTETQTAPRMLDYEDLSFSATSLSDTPLSNPSLPSFVSTATETSLVSVSSFTDLPGGSDPGISLSNNETQTLLDELEAFGESISTQTLESFLADGPPVGEQGGQRQHSGAQTHCRLISNQLEDLQTVDQSVLCSLGFDDDISPPASSGSLFGDTLNPVTFDTVVSMPSTSTMLTSSSSSFGALSTMESKAQQTGGEFSLEVFTNTTNTTNDEIPSTAETQTCTSDLDLSSLLNTSSSQTGDFTSYMHMETQTGSEEGMLQDFFNNMHTQTTDEYLTDLSFSDIETQTSLNVMESQALSLNVMEVGTSCLDIMNCQTPNPDISKQRRTSLDIVENQSSLSVMDPQVSSLDVINQQSADDIEKQRLSHTNTRIGTLEPPSVSRPHDVGIPPIVLQTSTGIQADLSFLDNGTQSTLNSSFHGVLAGGQIASASNTVETQTSVPPVPQQAHGASTAPSADIETQTFFAELDLGPDLTDSHTQTSLRDLMSLVKGLQ